VLINQLPMEALMIKASKIVLIALVGGLAACSDSTAPNAQHQDRNDLSGQGSTAQLTSNDTLRFGITIDPSKVTQFPLGAGNYIVFPAQSLCDPYTSTYGQTEWDKPCTVATSKFTVSVKAWLDGSGNPHLDFNPGIRFVPTLDPAGWVNMSFTDSYAALNPWYNILYCPTVGAPCINEAMSDPTMATITDPLSGRLTRRIKHFSGYMVGAGDAVTQVGTDWNSRSFNLSAKGPGAASSLNRTPRSGVLGPQSGVLGQLHEAARKAAGYMLASG
jgi:hypothetical protein